MQVPIVTQKACARFWRHLCPGCDFRAFTPTRPNQRYCQAA